MKKIASEIMTKPVITINLETPFTQACRIFDEFELHHLPVVDSDKKLLGMFSSTDALKAYNTKLFDKIINDEKIINDIITVEECMTDHEMYSLQINSDVKYAITLFQTFRIHSLPILDKNKLVGIITCTDIVRRLNKE